MNNMKDTDAPEVAAPDASHATTSRSTLPEPPGPPGAPHSAIPTYGIDSPAVTDTGTGLSPKSPVLAVFLAIMFLGHFYLGKYQRAVVIITTFFLSIMLLPVPFNIFVAIFIWFFNLFDAHRQAELEILSPANQYVRALERRKASVLFGFYMIGLGAILLVDQFFPIELYWLRKWWPVLLVAVGIYVIIGAIRERREDAEETSLPLSFSS